MGRAAAEPAAATSAPVTEKPTRRADPASTPRVGRRALLFSIVGVVIVSGAAAFLLLNGGGLGGSASPHTQGRLFIVDPHGDEFDLYWDYPGAEAPTSEPIARDVVRFGFLCVGRGHCTENGIHYRSDGGAVAYPVDEDGEGALVWTEASGQVSLMTDWAERSGAFVRLIPGTDWVGFTEFEPDEDEFTCFGGRGGEPVHEMLKGVRGSCEFNQAGAYLFEYSEKGARVHFVSWGGDRFELLDDAVVSGFALGGSHMAAALPREGVVVVYDSSGGEQRSIGVDGVVVRMMFAQSDDQLVYGVLGGDGELTWYIEESGQTMEVGSSTGQAVILEVDGEATLLMRETIDADDFTVWPDSSVLAGSDVAAALGAIESTDGAASWWDRSDEVIWRFDDESPYEFEGDAEELVVGDHLFVIDEDGLWYWPRDEGPVELADSSDHETCRALDGRERLRFQAFTSNFVTTDGRDAFFVTCGEGGGDGAIWSAPLDGSESPTEIEDGFDVASNLYLRDGWLYYTTHEDIYSSSPDQRSRRYDVRGEGRPEDVPDEAIGIPPSTLPIGLPRSVVALDSVISDDQSCHLVATIGPEVSFSSSDECVLVYVPYGGEMAWKVRLDSATLDDSANLPALIVDYAGGGDYVYDGTANPEYRYFQGWPDVFVITPVDSWTGEVVPSATLSFEWFEGG